MLFAHRTVDRPVSRHDYSRVTFGSLGDVDPDAVLNLMNDPDIRRHLPLARGHFGMAAYHNFIAAKARMWDEHGYGPWAFFLEREFIGWGGVQPEGDDVDVGLILRQQHWGAGTVLYRRIVDYAFHTLGATSVIALLPPSRTRIAALRRLGFLDDGEVVVAGERFNRFRLHHT